MVISKRQVEDGKSIYRDRGLLYLIYRSISYAYRLIIRPYLPTVGYRIRGYSYPHGNIRVNQKRKLFDKYLPGHFHHAVHQSAHEGGLVLGHRALTQKGDHVVIVGGGGGISTTAAAWQVGNAGRITVFDGRNGEKHDLFGIANIDQTMSLNRVTSEVELRHAIVSTDDIGENINTGVEVGDDTPIVHPSDLPTCDVLELDCNAAELSILRNLDVRPRAMIVEIEAPMYRTAHEEEEHPIQVLGLLTDLGYTIVQQTGHNGTAISFDELVELIEKGYELGMPDGFHYELESGANNSTIVYAVREDFEHPVVDDGGLTP